jgi:hypothetical protein
MGMKHSKELGIAIVVVLVLVLAVGSWYSSRGPEELEYTSPLAKDNEIHSVFQRNADQDLVITTALALVWTDAAQTTVTLRYLFTNEGERPLQVEFIHGYLMTPGEAWRDFTHIANLTDVKPFGLTTGQSEGRELKGSVVSDDAVLVVQVRYTYFTGNGIAEAPRDVFLELPVRQALDDATPVATPIATPVTS